MTIRTDQIEAARKLYEDFRRAAHGQSYDVTLQAALNILVECMRQQNKTLTGALDHADRINAGLKASISKNYLANGRRSIIAHREKMIILPKKH